MSSVSTFDPNLDLIFERYEKSVDAVDYVRRKPEDRNPHNNLMMDMYLEADKLKSELGDKFDRKQWLKGAMWMFNKRKI